jgi:hypothetical protein
MGCGSSPLVHSPTAEEGAASVTRRQARQNAFPLDEGRFLGFADSATAFLAPEIDYSLEVVGPAPRLGTGVMEVVDPDTRSYLISDNRGVRIVALSERHDGAVRRLPSPMRLITYPLRVGRTWHDRYGRGKQALHVHHWIADRLVVRTPDGNFDAFQIERRTWRGSQKPSYSSDSVGRWTYYYAPGVGPVQIGTQWPSVTTRIYQLCTQHARAVTQASAPTGNSSWRGLTAGLEPLLGE